MSGRFVKKLIFHEKSKMWWTFMMCPVRIRIFILCLKTDMLESSHCPEFETITHSLTWVTYRDASASKEHVFVMKQLSYLDSIAVSLFVDIFFESDKYRIKTNPNNNLIMIRAGLSPIFLFTERPTLHCIHPHHRENCWNS